MHMEQLSLRRVSEAYLVTALPTGFGGTSASAAADAVCELSKASPGGLGDWRGV